MIKLNYDLEEILYYCEYDKVFKTEVFKDIPNYEGLYQVSDLGRVKGLERKVKRKNRFLSIKGIILKNCLNIHGYECVYLNSNGIRKCCRVHQLVAIVFLNHIQDGFKTVVDHKNNNRLDNRLLNLQLISSRENSTKDSKNKNGLLGVKKNGNKYEANIRHNGKSIYLGSFKTKELAHEKYWQKRREIESRDLY